MNFFKSLSGKRKGTSGFPKFHKKGIKDSYRVTMINNNIKFDFENQKIKVPKIGWINYSDNRIFDSSFVKSITISKSKTEKYYASVLCKFEIDDIDKITYSDDLIVNGFDMSLDKFYVDCEGYSPDFIKQQKRYQAKLTQLQRQLSRK